MVKRTTADLSRPMLALACAFVAGALVLAARGETAAGSALWGNLEPGPHPVGFMTIEKYDYSRSFQPKRDYFGATLPGERGRPMQVCVWYPAKAPAGAKAVVFGDYAFSPPEDMCAYQVLSGIHNREIGFLMGLFGGDDARVMEVLGMDMQAVRAPEPADGMFPPIVFHGDLAGGITENAVLCEYLASHGFVVATTHSLGPSSVRADGSAAGIETLADDMGFVVSRLQDLAFVDRDKLGVAGHGAGAVAALLVQMRNSDVDAVAGIYSAAEAMPPEVLDRNPFWEAARVCVPVLVVRSGTPGDDERALLDSFRYAQRYLLTLPAAGPLALTTYGLLPALVDPAIGAPADTTRQAYETACEYVLDFFEAHLRGNQASLDLLAASPLRAGTLGRAVEMSRMDAEQRPPTQAEFMAMLDQGKVDVATATYDRFKSMEGATPMFAEAAMNVMGYRYLQRGMLNEAVAIFKMNAEAYPRSANCWDSLAEAYTAAGDLEHAAECADRAVAALPDDTGISEDLRAAIRANAERYKRASEQEREDADE